MRILLLASDPPGYTGGLGGTIGTLRDGLRRLGHEVDVRTPRVRLGEVKFSAMALQDFSRYDVVHVHGPAPTLSDLVCLNPTVKALVLTHHCDVEWLSKSFSSAYRSVHKLLHGRTDCIIVTTEDYRALYGPTRARVEVIWHAGPSWEVGDEVIDQKDPGFRVLFVGQLRPYKGIEHLLYIAPRLPGVQFAIVGGGRLAPELNRIARSYQNVEMLGNLGTQELREQFRRAHVICLPSINRMEAYGIALVEGANFGAVPVASDLPGVRENLRILGGDSFPVANDTALQSAIKTLAESPGLWKSRAKMSLARAKEYGRVYTVDRFVKEHEKIYASVADRSNVRSRISSG
jgi:glycosyltransferase involved in cell wall biosynthesis